MKQRHYDDMFERDFVEKLDLKKKKVFLSLCAKNKKKKKTLVPYRVRIRCVRYVVETLTYIQRRVRLFNVHAAHRAVCE